MPRYRLENFKQNVARLLDYLKRNDPLDLCAIFDIGTKATKLLVGPKKPPTRETWNSSAFFNDGQLFPLGADFDLWKNRLDIKSSGALEGVCYFVETYRKVLSEVGVPLGNIHGVGTAVFRWMNNQEEVVNHMRKHAGFDIHILEAQDEAYLSGLSIFHTYTFGTTDQDAFGTDDIILLFDQGGGSTEVSYFRPKGESKGNLDSLHEFGTVSLQRMFFEPPPKPGDDGPPDPTMNRNRISTQFGRIKEYLGERVAAWPGFPELLEDRVKIHAYGMGTALSKCLRGGNIFSQHNRLLTIQDMDETLSKSCQDLDNSKQQVKTLFAALKEEQVTGRKELSDRLVMLYGLPVYQQLLLKFGLDRLRFAGFGLRYGAYFAVCYGRKLNNLDESKDENSSNRQLANEPIKVFLSHTSADNKLAKQIAEDLQQAGIGVWLDEAEIQVGDRIIAKIAEGISKSQFLAVMLSEKSQGSNWVEKEVSVKLTEEINSRKTCVLPIRLDDCALPSFLADKAYADFRTDYKSGLGDLIRAINSYK
jgi:exopolyphosphatase/pppGpp-phosphohydrolase